MAKLANGIVITSGDLLVNVWFDMVFFKKLLTAFCMVPSGLNPRKRLTSEETVNCENTSSMLIFSIIFYFFRAISLPFLKLVSSPEKNDIRIH